MEINDLRSTLKFLEEKGENIRDIDAPLDPNLEVAKHYADHVAGVPASTVSRDEDVVRYKNVIGHSKSVLMGLFGSRRRNMLMIARDGMSYHETVMQALKKRVEPVSKSEPPCQEIVITSDIDLMAQLPILNLTSRDAGPYISLGLVLAKDPVSGAFNASVHRLCVHSKNTLSISIYPGHHLGDWHAAAQERGENLPISINLGLDPALYFASCLTEPLCPKGESELDIAGGIRGRAVEISPCVSVKEECISNAEIIIEGELTSEMVAENAADSSLGSMPEFLGYQGVVSPDQKVPLIKVTAITHRKDPIYQSLIGPGKEQSELQSITPELATLQIARQKFGLDVVDSYYHSAGGGLLTSILQVRKNSEEDDKKVVEASKAILAMVAPFKHMYLVDEDVNPHSADDLIWAMTSRFQADIDTYNLPSDKPFPMDPTQRPNYREGEDRGEGPVKTVFDCTVPWRLRDTFDRPFVPRQSKGRVTAS